MTEPTADGASESIADEAKGAAVDVADLHDLLLRLAAHLTDPFLAQCRSWLAQHEPGPLVRSLCATVVTTRIPLFPGEAEVLADALARDGADPRAVAAIEINEDEVEFAPRCSFSPTSTEAGERGAAANSAMDPAVLAAIVDAAGRDDLIGVWRTWRTPLDGSPWRRPRWVYLLELPPTADLAAITGRVQEALVSVGETDPLVETFATRQHLPVYQRFALGDAVLLWANTPDSVPTVARVFDFADPETGPGFTDDHERIEDDDEIAKIVAYLDAGELLMATLSTMPDVIDPEHPVTVPMDFRTDGAWIWPDTVQYYLARHRLAPDSEMLRHIRRVEYAPVPLTAVELHRAMRVLRQPVLEEPAWTYQPI